MPIAPRPLATAFASEAKVGEVQAFPNWGRGWGLTFDPGYSGGVPPMEWFNSILKAINEGVIYSVQRGICTWSADYDYPVKSYVEHEGVTWCAAATSKGVVPGTNSQVWYGLASSTFAAVGQYPEISRASSSSVFGLANTGSVITNTPSAFAHFGFTGKYNVHDAGTVQFGISAGDGSAGSAGVNLHIKANSDSDQTNIWRKVMTSLDTYNKAQVDAGLAERYLKSQVYTKAEVDAGLAERYTVSQVNNLFTNYYTKDQVNVGLAERYTKAEVTATFAGIHGVAGAFKVGQHISAGPRPDDSVEANSFLCASAPGFPDTALIVNQWFIPGTSGKTYDTRWRARASHATFAISMQGSMSGVETGPLFTVTSTGDTSSAGKHTFTPPTQEEVTAGIVDNQAVTPKKLKYGFGISLAPNGYIAFPLWLSGLRIQWCTGRPTTIGDEVQDVVFPVEFPSACLFTVVGTLVSNNISSDAWFQEITGTTRTKCSVVSQWSGAGSVGAAVTPRILAIGF